LVSARVKRQVVTDTVQTHEQVQSISKPVAASLDLVKERIRQLDKLFDDNVLSVDEYVELRKRVSGGNSLRPTNLKGSRPADR